MRSTSSPDTRRRRTPIFRIGCDRVARSRKIVTDGATRWLAAGRGRSTASIHYVRSQGRGAVRRCCRFRTTGGDPVRLTYVQRSPGGRGRHPPCRGHLGGRRRRPTKIQVFLVTPHDFDPNKKYPFILNVHGGPQIQWSDSFRGDWQVYPGKGYIVAIPNPTGSTGYGQKPRHAISKDWGGKVFVT